MSKVGAIAKLTAQAGKRDELAAALDDVMQAVEAEEGTLHYVLHADAKDDTVLWMTEIYTGQDALTAHMQGDAFKALGPKLGALLGGAPELFFTAPLKGKGL
jgi:quinol monooxygenase YgiN